MNMRAKGLGIVLSFGLVSFAFGQESPDWIVTPKGTYVILPPVVVGQGNLTGSSWSTDGKHLAVAQTHRGLRPNSDVGDFLEAYTNGSSKLGKTTLSVWTQENGVKEVWNSDAQVLIGQMTWLPGSDTLLAVVVEEVNDPATQTTKAQGAVLSVNAKTGHFQFLPEPDGWIPSVIVPSPTKAEAVVQLVKAPTLSIVPTAVSAAPVAVSAISGDAGSAPPPIQNQVEPTIVEVVSPSGVTRTVPTTKDVTDIEWDADGAKWFVGRYDARAKRSEYAILGQDGDLSAANPQPQIYEVKDIPRDIELRNAPVTIGLRKVRRNSPIFWLSSPTQTEKSDVMLTPGCSRPSLSPSGKAIQYEIGGVLEVRTLVMVPEEIHQVLLKAERARLLSNVKQIGLSAIMYSTDNEDRLPSASGFLESVYPYAKNSEIFDGFNYTPPDNPDLTAIESPADTVLGYIEGPGGRAVIYSDGHAKWINN